MKKMPCEQHIVEQKTNGGFKTVTTYSYVAVLTEIGGSEVKAVRLDGFERKTDVYKAIDQQHPGWKMKLVNRLYDEDFEV